MAEVLRQQDAEPENREPSSADLSDWEGFETRVEKIYGVLLNLKGDKVVISRDVKLKGRDGIVHQFDVFYEFSRAGVTHRVAIECKDEGRRIEKDSVMAFHSKVRDVVPGVQGVMVSARGYQSGAKKFAEYNGVLVLTMDELPGIGSLLAIRLESVACPDEDSIGEPFWSIYEVDDDGQTNGNLYGQMIQGRQGALLFYSKRQCEEFLASRSSTVRTRYAVRGMRQRHLRGFIQIADTRRSDYWIVLDVKSQSAIGLVPISRKTLIKDYVIGEPRLPDEPLVAPGF